MADEFNVREAGQKRARWEELSETSGASIIHQATVTLDNDEIKALPGGVATEGFTELVAAPGANKAFRIQAMQLVSFFAGGAYANVSDNAQLFGAVGVGVASYQDQTLVARNIVGENSPLTTMLADTNSRVIYLSPAFQVAPDASIGNATAQLLSVIENQPIGVYCFNVDENFTGGHANNTLLVSVAYYVLNTVTGEFE